MLNIHRNIVYHEKCRLCYSGNVSDLFSIGNQYINDFVTESDINNGRKAPLSLMMCRNCSLIQLRHTAPQELLYSGYYWYRSGVTDTMKAALKDVTDSIQKINDINDGDVVLDIGANDGTLLETYSNPGIVKVGCEPANNLIKYLREKTNYVMHDFWSSEGYDSYAQKWNIGKAKVVTALGMFYDLEDPNKFIGDIAKILDEGGLFVSQLMCLSNMLKKNDLGNICHEHIEYYSLESLKYLYEKNGLEIFKIEENDVNGGSYRIYARHLKNGSISFTENITDHDLHEFKARIDKNKELCSNFIKKEVSSGKTVYVYGASTKGNVILQYYGLDNSLITAAAERSPEKWGKFTVGTWIPIVSEQEAREKQTDYFLVLPWAFFDEFYERESQWREKGGKFIVPLPDFRVVD